MAQVATKEKQGSWVLSPAICRVTLANRDALIVNELQRCRR
jgi:hypothetical protein